MTRANARYHLGILISQGLVQEIGTSPSRHQGRPSILYAPSSHSRGENFDLLANALLAMLDTMPGTGDSEHPYRQVAAQMIMHTQDKGSSLSHQTPDSHITIRLRNAIQQLNNWRYHSRWEAHSEAPHIILGNCPYLSILPTHPELCKIDRELIELLVGSPTELLGNRIQDERGIPYCRFRLI